MEAEKKIAEKEAKKIAGRKYRATVKELIAFCGEKMPGTNYDRFYIDELVKKYPYQENLDALFESVRQIEATSVEDYVDKFLGMVDKERLAKVKK